LFGHLTTMLCRSDLFDGLLYTTRVKDTASTSMTLHFERWAKPRGTGSDEVE